MKKNFCFSTHRTLKTLKKLSFIPKLKQVFKLIKVLYSKVILNPLMKDLNYPCWEVRLETPKQYGIKNGNDVLMETDNSCVNMKVRLDDPGAWCKTG